VSTSNPFYVGDKVVFAPGVRTIGWHQHSFERCGILPGQEGTVSQVSLDHIEIDHNPHSAMHWSQYKPINAVTAKERERMRNDFESRNK
jgi:hypothetical protein